MKRLKSNSSLRSYAKIYTVVNKFTKSGFTYSVVTGDCYLEHEFFKTDRNTLVYRLNPYKDNLLLICTSSLYFDNASNDNYFSYESLNNYSDKSMHRFYDERVLAGTSYVLSNLIKNSKNNIEIKCYKDLREFRLSNCSKYYESINARDEHYYLRSSFKNYN